jgi:uncharacterized protein
MHYILFYDYVPDIAERRGPFRSAHLTALQESFDAGNLTMGGALTDPLDGAALVFRSAESADGFAATDPYVLNGLVTKWHVRKWQTVLGDGAVLPPP